MMRKHESKLLRIPSLRISTHCYHKIQYPATLDSFNNTAKGDTSSTKTYTQNTNACKNKRRSLSQLTSTIEWTSNNTTLHNRILITATSSSAKIQRHVHFHHNLN
ncbi:hypothetical protein KC19_VG224500 [Ceratodon purpureus]|uniref:Uncharacterized protein n=1 Tax=Ceratodon purpureus TaxID=3225 RepID=A0A8T0HSL1_CERPU|nr:hypothetical protein KC19_VG224500 [Ceratodon purpureus]